MQTEILKQLAISASLLMLPGLSLAANQQFDGSGAVMMDYPNGNDELLVSNFNNNLYLAWDIFQSDGDGRTDNWTLDRSYTIADYEDANDSYLYNPYESGPAVRYNGDWYFTVSVQSIGEFTTEWQGIEIWRVTKRGAKPQAVLSLSSTSSYYGHHQKIMVLDDTLVVVDNEGNVYRSTNGTDWTNTNTITEATDNYIEDMVSNGNTLFLSISGSIYKSGDATTFTLLGSACSGETTCAFNNLALRPNKGIYAIATIYEDTGTADELWVYKNGNLTAVAGLGLSGTDMRNFGDHTYFLHYRSSNYNHYSVYEVTSGDMDSVTGRRSGSPIGLLTKNLALAVNPASASYVTLVSY